MRILHIINSLGSLGGAEAMLVRLASNLPVENQQIVSLITVSESVRARFINTASKITALGATGPLSLTRSAVQIAARIRSYRPDVVLCWMYHSAVIGTFAAKLAGAKTSVVWNIRHSLDDPSSDSRSTRTALLGTKALSRLPDAIVFCSRNSLEQHVDYGYSNPRMVHIPNGYSFPDPPPRVQPEQVSDGVVIGTAARFHPNKDYGNLFAAFAKLKVPGAKLRLAGRGVTKLNPEFVRLLDDNKVDSGSVEALGEVTDMLSFYRSIDLFVLPSATEAFPNVLVEAMAAGLPCVTTDVGDAREIAGAFALVVPPQDPEALSMSLAQLARLNPAERTLLGQDASRSVRSRYGIADCAYRYHELFRAL